MLGPDAQSSTCPENSTQISVHTGAYDHTYMYSYVDSIYVSLSLCVFVFVCTYIYIYVHTCVCVCGCVCMYIYIYICMCVCVMCVCVCVLWFSAFYRNFINIEVSWTNLSSCHKPPDDVRGSLLRNGLDLEREVAISSSKGTSMKGLKVGTEGLKCRQHLKDLNKVSRYICTYLYTDIHILTCM